MAPPQNSPAATLVALLARAEPPPAEMDEAAAGAVVRCALLHGVAPLLWLAAGGRDAFPPRARAHLRRIYVANLGCAERLLAEQQRLAGEFASRSLPLWTLKGPQLGIELYGDLAARQSADLDLLIRPEDLPASDRLLAELGYARAARGPIEDFREAQELLYLRIDKLEPSPARPQPSFTFAVDLHQRLVPYAPRDPLAERVRASGWTPELLLLALAANAVTHRLSRLKYLLDVAAELRAAAPALDWNALVQAAAELDIAPGIFYVLEFAARLAGVELPESFLRRLRPAENERRRAGRILGATPAELAERGPAFDGPSGARVILLCARPGAPRWRILWRLLFPAAWYLRQEQNLEPGAWLLPYYLRRLLGKSLRAA